MDPSKFQHVYDTIKTISLGGQELLVPEMAYKNLSWLSTRGAKLLRINAEFIEGEERMRNCGVKHTILFFGSARARMASDHKAAVQEVQEKLADSTLTSEEREVLQQQLSRLEKTAWMTRAYDDVEELSMRLTQWSMGRVGTDRTIPYIISTGGGPGLMEAANRGASRVHGGISAGVGISLPFEAGLNPYVTPELGFTNQYYFLRKVQMVSNCRAFIAAPGGYGTMDELFEVLTLLQSGKIEHPFDMPIVLLDSKFWKSVVNWQALADYGVVSQYDVDRLFFTDSVDEAFEYITKGLVKWEALHHQERMEDLERRKKLPSRLSIPARNHFDYLQKAAANRREKIKLERARNSSTLKELVRTYSVPHCTDEIIHVPVDKSPSATGLSEMLPKYLKGNGAPDVASPYVSSIPTPNLLDDTSTDPSFLSSPFHEDFVDDTVFEEN